MGEFFRLGIVTDDRNRLACPFRQVTEQGEHLAAGLGIQICSRLVGEPDGPMISNTCPESSASVAPSSATTRLGPSPKILLIPIVWRIAEDMAIIRETPSPGPRS